jgi:AhpD family alkylhydroperoxidase
MPQLTTRERALVSLGAAMGSNCTSCIEHHVPAWRDAGLNDAEISEAIDLADKLRQVPARKTLEAAANLLSNSPREAAAKQPCCG